jgi:hypothetical protein
MAGEKAFPTDGNFAELCDHFGISIERTRSISKYYVGRGAEVADMLAPRLGQNLLGRLK